MAAIPLALICQPEGPPPYPQQFIDGVAAQAQTPGLTAMIKVTSAAAYARDFSAIDYARSIFPDNAPLHINISALPLTPNAGITYRTVTLPLTNNGHEPVPTELPVLWDDGWINDFSIKCFSNLHDYVVEEELVPRTFALGWCPSCRLVGDGEFTIASTNPKPYGDNFSDDWLAVDYSEDAVRAALNVMSRNIATIFSDIPDLPLMFGFLSSSTQKLGFQPDPTSSFAASMMAGMVAAAAEVGGLVTPVQQSFTTNLRPTNFALEQGVLYQRLMGQLVPSYNTPDLVNAGLAGLLRIPNLIEIQIHYNQVQAAVAFMATQANSGLIDFNGQLIDFGEGLISYAGPAGT